MPPNCLICKGLHNTVLRVNKKSEPHFSSSYIFHKEERQIKSKSTYDILAQVPTKSIIPNWRVNLKSRSWRLASWSRRLWFLLLFQCNLINRRTITKQQVCLQNTDRYTLLRTNSNSYKSVRLCENYIPIQNNVYNYTTIPNFLDE
jgi:hypothetical protein